MNIRPMHNQSDIDVITWLRFPLMIGVVFWHNNLYALVEIWEGTAPQWPHWLIYIFNYLHLIILPAPVPVLFIISGYLFFRNTSTGECVPFADKGVPVKRGRKIAGYDSFPVVLRKNMTV